METTKTYKGPLSFFQKHLNGDYSLARSFWVNTFLILIIAPLAGVMLLPWLSNEFPSRYSSTGFLLITVVNVFAWVWAISGTWASANKHVSRGGRKFWVNTAKFFVVLEILRMLGEIEGMSGPIAEHWKVALGWQLGPDASIEVRADGKSILIAGGINDGTAERLLKALEIAPFVTTVVLDSTGGWVRQGNMIAKVISDRNLNTYVENECTSACTIAFLAGKERGAGPNSKIGFHSFRSIGANKEFNRITDSVLVKKSYSKAGLSDSFIKKVLNTPHDEVWYPSHGELAFEGVLTSMHSQGVKYDSFESCIDSNRDIVESFKSLASSMGISEISSNEQMDLDNAIFQVRYIENSKHITSETLCMRDGASKISHYLIK